MNLQLTVPYVPCKFRCPFCIARRRKHEYNFPSTDLGTYFTNLSNAINDNNIRTIVITGECDPSQQEMFVQVVTSFIRKYFSHVTIEIQTRDGGFFIARQNQILFNTLAVSMSHVAQFQNLMGYMSQISRISKVVRPVFILNKFLDVRSDNLDFDYYNIKQATFKELQLGDDPDVNAWIEANRFTDLQGLNTLVEKFPNVSIVVDTNCQDSEGRYLIFRPDGQIYAKWEDKDPIKEV